MAGLVVWRAVAILGLLLIGLVTLGWWRRTHTVAEPEAAPPEPVRRHVRV